MTSESDATNIDPSIARQRNLLTLLGALVVAVVLSRLVSVQVLRGAVPEPVLQVFVTDGSVWLPLVLGIVWVSRRTGQGLNGALRLGLGDLVFAVGIVVMTRVVDAALALALTGTTGLAPAPFLGTPDFGLLLASAVSAVLVSPVLEEIFFRGLFQRLLATELTPRTRWLAVLLTAFLFALSHVLIGTSTSTLVGFQVFVTTFALGILTGALVAMTGRVGGAIVAHVLFNAVAVVATWPR